MANTLTGLVPEIYAALDVVSRELVGFIPSVSRNSGAERAAVGELVRYPVVPAITSSAVTPSMTIPTPANITIPSDTMAITNMEAAQVAFTGEEVKGLNNGPGFLSIQAQLIAQGLRTITNKIEADLAAAAYLGASRAYGTGGTTPFASDLSGSAQIRKILDDNGAPASMRSLVIDTTAGANLRTLQQLSKANEAGSSMTLRDGELLNIHGFSVKESAGIRTFTKGTGAGATTNAVGYAVGATVITLASAGTGTIKAGDVITFAGDTNKYVVASGDTDVSNGGTITLAKPGLRVAIPASATAITVGNSYVGNVAFSPDAIHLVARPIALPNGGDAATDRMMITDPRSGMSYEFAIYQGYKMNFMEISLAWGVKAAKPEYIATLLG